MNYKKSLFFTAFSLGFGLLLNGQFPDFSLNGLGRSVISNNTLSGNRVDGDNSIQKRNISGYNLFDLQTNLDLDSTFHSMAIFRTRSPFGSSFGSKTNFEFRQFSMGGNLNGLKYEFGDIRIQLTPYTVFNSDLANTGYESDIFTERREILEYENFNSGNTWLMQGAASQYGWDLNKNRGIGIYAFTTRTVNTNNFDTPDQLLAGGRLEYASGSNLKFGLNDVNMFDLVTQSSDYDHNVNVLTGDINFKSNVSEQSILEINAEGGFSNYEFTDNLLEIDSGYGDFTVDLDIDYTLKDKKIILGLDFRAVGAAFISPASQSRRFVPSANPMLFKTIGESDRGQLYFDQFTSEEVYNRTITPALMGYNQYYNNLSPYGKATPNRMVVGFSVANDTSSNGFDAGLNVNYGSELIGEGGDALRSFLVLKGGAVTHLGNLLKIKRQIDVNAGARYESTQRLTEAKIDLSSLLLDFGLSAEVFNRIDILGGFKYFSAVGNEYMAKRDGFNLVSSFDEYQIDVNELILSFGTRIRFSKNQAFSLNYNLSQFVDENSDDLGLNLGQVFFNFTGKF